MIGNKHLRRQAKRLRTLAARRTGEVREELLAIAAEDTTSRSRTMGKITNAELKKLAAEHVRWVERLKASGRKFAQCHCPDCTGVIELLRPAKGERDYTSVIRCPHCGAMFYHRTSADGTVRITPMES